MTEEQNKDNNINSNHPIAHKKTKTTTIRKNSGKYNNLPVGQNEETVKNYDNKTSNILSKMEIF